MLRSITLLVMAITWTPLSYHSPPGPSAVLLPGRGWADFSGSLGSRSGWAQSHVVCRWTRPVWTGIGGTAKSLVCHQASGLEGRATKVRAKLMVPYWSIWVLCCNRFLVFPIKLMTNSFRQIRSSFHSITKPIPLLAKV